MVVFRIVALLGTLLAITLGWFARHELPLGLFFATVIPLMQYKLPSTLVGHGKMSGSTPPIPDDLQPAPRPSNEMFLALPFGRRMPQNGIGMCCRYSAYDDELVYRTTLWYLLLGGRHIDTAHLYLNHKAIGRALHEAITVRGIPRSEIFVTSKLFPSHFGHESTLQTVPTFLTELGLDYIDLVLLHAPATFPYIMTNECIKKGIKPGPCRQETWKALSTLRESGMIRNIGVSNFAVKHLEELRTLPDTAPIANNQIQYSPFTDASVQETFTYCAAHNITITAYSPLGGLMDKDKAFVYDILQEVAEKYKRPVSQLMLRWAMQSGAAVIPGTGNPEHMRENLDIYNFELSPEDMEVIDGLKHKEDVKKMFTVGMDAKSFE